LDKRQDLRAGLYPTSYDGLAWTMLLLRNSATVSLFLCRVRTAQPYVRSGFLNRGPRPPLGVHGAVLRGPRAEAFVKWLSRDIAKPKTKIGICIDEQGATSVESLWKEATNHESLRTTVLGNGKRSRFRWTRFSACRWAAQNWSVFYMFISLMHDDSLERKGSSENRNAIWKTYNWLKILQAAKIKTKNQFQGCCQCSSWVRSMSAS